MGEIEGVEEEEEERECEAQIAEEVPRRDAIFLCVSFAASLPSYWQTMVVFGACGQG